MNKAEIIRKISKKAGVPDTEAKKFFEIFLKHASDLLKPGDSLKIHGVGLFQLRVGQIENRTRQDSGDKFIYSDLIVFLDDEDKSLKEREEIIFNVPSGIEEQYQPVDSYFSLSFGKPIIPLKGVKETEFFIPPSGTELRSLIESKINRLLDESEKAEGGKETETIHLKPEEEFTEQESGRNKPGAGESSEEIKVPSRSDFLKTREFEDLSWDFGENLSQEIEEESILDTDKDTEIEPPYVVSEKIIEQPGETVPVFEEEKNEENPDEDIFEEIIDEDIGETDIYEDSNEEVIEQKEEIKSEETREEFQKQTPEAEKIQDKEIPEHAVIEEKQEVHPEKPRPEEPALKNFQRVKSLTKEFNSTQFDETEEIAEEKPKKITEVRGGYQKVRRTTAEFDFDLSGIKGLDEIEEPPVKEKKSSLKEYQGYRKRSSIPSLIVAFIVVIALAGVIFLYLKLKSANNGPADENKSAVSSQQTNIIERDYDVPVTYPYEKSDEKGSAELNENVKEQTGKNILPENSNNNISKSQTDLSEIRDPVNAERIGNYIFKYPEGIVVQTSSWKSRTIALGEVKKYRDAGYTAFAEQSDIAGMGLYYRVRVGYFKSLQEAENFANGKQ